MYHSLTEAIQTIFGDNVTVTSRRAIGGGDINDACKLELSNGEPVFMKSNRMENLAFFTAEERGLAAIRSTNTIGTPQVLGIGIDQSDRPFSFLLLTFIESGTRIPDYWETFGRELAQMHAVEQETFGWSSDNYIGMTSQKNTSRDSFLDFFRESRLEPQFRMAEKYFSAGDHRKIDKLLSHMENYYIEPEHPSLLHGDLWSGNHMTGSDGKAWLIDPAVYVGHPEADLAMTELFGRCPQSFYDAYNQVSPLQPGYERRRDFYNLYQLLNHLIMFGGSYLSSVRRILDQV